MSSKKLKAQTIETLSISEQKELSNILFEKRLFGEPLFVFYSNLNGCFRCQSLFATIFKDTSILHNSVIIVSGLDTSQIDNYRNNFSIPNNVSIIHNSILSLLFDRLSSMHLNEIAVIKYYGGNTTFYSNLKSNINFKNLQISNVLNPVREINMNIDKSILINGIFDFLKIDSTFYYITSPTKFLFKFKEKSSRIEIDSFTYLKNFNTFIEDVHDSLKTNNSDQESVNLYYSYIKQLNINNYSFENLVNINNKAYVFGTVSYPLNTPAEHIRICSQRFFSPIDSESKELNFLKTYNGNSYIIPSELYGYYFDSNLYITPYLIGKYAFQNKQIPMVMKYNFYKKSWNPTVLNDNVFDRSYFTMYEKGLKDLVMKKIFLSKNDFSFTHMPITKIEDKVYLNFGYADSLFLKVGYTIYNTSYIDSTKKNIISIESYYGNIALLIRQIDNDKIVTLKYFKLNIDYLKKPVFKIYGEEILCMYFDKDIKIKYFTIPF